MEKGVCYFEVLLYISGGRGLHGLNGKKKDNPKVGGWKGRNNALKASSVVGREKTRKGNIIHTN